jgi:DNA-binding CsgD family transcriptional regulator
MARVSLSDLERTSQKIRAAGFDPSLWDDTLEHIRTTIDLGIVSIVSHHTLGENHIGSDWAYSTWKEEATFEAYEEHFYKIDPFIQAMTDVDSDGLCTRVQDVLDEKEWIECEFYQDFQSVAQMVDWGTIAFKRSGGSLYELPVADSGRGGISQHKTDALNALAPVLIEAIDTNNNLAMKAINLSYGPGGVVDQLEKPCFVLDAQGRIVEANDLGSAFLREKKLLIDIGRKLSLIDRLRNYQFQSLVSELIRHSLVGGYSPLLRRAPKSYEMNIGSSAAGVFLLHLSVLPSTIADIPRPLGGQRPSLLITITPQTTQSTPSIEDFCVRNRLTKAEADLVSELSKGLSLKESAHLLGRSYNTARSQLRAVFEKSNVRSQNELMRALFTDVESNISS